jgi:hypothetical protein
LLEFTQFDGEVHPFLSQVSEFAVVGNLAFDFLEAFSGDVFGMASAEMGVA